MPIPVSFPEKLLASDKVWRKHIDTYLSLGPPALPLSRLNRQTSNPVHNESSLEAGLLRCSNIPGERFYDPRSCKSATPAGALSERWADPSNNRCGMFTSRYYHRRSHEDITSNIDIKMSLHSTIVCIWDLRQPLRIVTSCRLNEQDRFVTARPPTDTIVRVHQDFLSICYIWHFHRSLSAVSPSTMHHVWILVSTRPMIRSGPTEGESWTTI